MNATGTAAQAAFVMTKAQMWIVLGILAGVAYMLANLALVGILLYTAPDDQKPKCWGTASQKKMFWKVMLFGVILAPLGKLPFVKIVIASKEA